jgi:hypothetical protein
MLDEERIAKTKECIRHVVLFQKLKVITSWELINRIESMWDFRDDAQMREYRMLYRQVEKEMQDGQ